ncbi:restriction endonuclease subunit S [Vaginisenegalia massiliensis]|uniref:restriction endonuclease subunit S n=1 Tax=Vaginisenegalia massiliensis TaxID=2058294 RepID=UPI000F52D132|nr:restriction endonuclease subunit S [Vaginisenegalia massiliensis]
MKLNEIFLINAGMNITRLNKESYDGEKVYSNEDIINDLCHVSNDNSVSKIKFENRFVVRKGDILYNLATSKASVVSEANQGKLFNQNFVQLVSQTGDVDSKYVCFILNESQLIKKQMYKQMQGSTVPKLTPSILGEIDIKLIELEKQKLLGHIYFSMNRLAYLSELESSLQQKLMTNILTKYES